MTDKALLPPLEVCWRPEVLEEKELMSPRSPEASEEPPGWEDGDTAVSFSCHSTTGSSVS